MVFQPSENNAASPSLFNLVDQITEAVRQKLLQEAAPLLAGWDHSAIPQPVAEPRIEAPKATTAPESESLASKIDHTLLKPDATREEIQKICEEARQHHFATVCVNSAYVGMAAEFLKGCSTRPIAVVGFPLGAAATTAKAFEAHGAIRAGAREIDMVINIGALKSKDYALVFDDIRQVVAASRPYPVKVILETSSLNEEQKIIACALAKAAGAAFVKTSTGFGAGGATAEDVALMRRIVGPEMGVKASGGIRTRDDAQKMIAAGANRIGASASVTIVTQATTEKAKGDKPSLY